ncbi:phosphate ABC transporter substrate-binding protein PstS [Psychrobacter sp. AOP22-C1-22]|uniref:phosphate ABC transporter substrate-binding protein PstS n=1 Tax=unclassified Psychrobacter TaxID=196806 RepID=UPI00178792EE|nr:MULTISPECIES: phosphate ABC transporter substrate-binding protein PstS [unclassified Psychrobacter]MBE0407310.1 phosphate ABC transporter substrate-binding protein PstS [Psychrobacter sp. FME6]MBE0445494.1 phosphate ABC transporter substrate-binding protein PstS [Psychrobacter sp. FME5]MDN5801876.1 phosphate ABC transporter substrate-binding protein PstS [Psychrobacter sp.]MDN5890988.1 phosphate ABC transporter substrate-binding protein PstS [Psychrobacter sp.]
MRYSFIAVAIASTLALAACNQTTSNNKSDKTNESATAAPSTTSTSSDANASSAENISMNITGAGASFPQPIYAKWSDAYHKATGGQVNYQSIGSSGGIKQIVAKTVDFGASDAPMTPEELNEAGLIQFPTVIGGVVPIVNIDGIKPGQLKLDGKMLAEIYLGKISKWNDPAIAAMNPDLTLPDAAITTVFRSDGSGTTFNFTDYLAKVSNDWQDSVGVDKTVKWPTSATGAGGKGNEGVSSYVTRMKNSIGYVEYAYATQNGMSHVALKNAAGNVVQPSAKTFAAAGDIDWSQQEGFYKVITNSETAQAWPIAAATFILVHKQPQDAKQVAGVLKFFDWAYAQGDDDAMALDYVPFPDTAVALFKAKWNEVVDSEGQPIYRQN